MKDQEARIFEFLWNKAIELAKHHTTLVYHERLKNPSPNMEIKLKQDLETDMKRLPMLYYEQMTKDMMNMSLKLQKGDLE